MGTLNTEMKTTTKLVKDLVPMDCNPRSISPEELTKLKRSMTHFGYVEPIVWNEKTGHVVGGHQRLKILRQMRVKEIDVVVVNLSEDKEKALNAALNKISGDWDEVKLAAMLTELQNNQFDVSLTGFENHEIENLQLFLDDNYQKQNFDDIIDQFSDKSGVCKKDEHWFYVEFYGDKKRFKQLTKKLKGHLQGKSKHELDKDFFHDLVMKHA